MTVVLLYFHASCICKWNMQLIFVNRVFLREWYCEIADSCWGVREFLGMLCTCFYENRPLVLLWTQPISHRFLYRRSLFNINYAPLFRYVTQQLMKWHCFQRTVYKIACHSDRISVEIYTVFTLLRTFLSWYCFLSVFTKRFAIG